MAEDTTFSYAFLLSLAQVYTASFDGTVRSWSAATGEVRVGVMNCKIFSSVPKTCASFIIHDANKSRCVRVLQD